MTALLDRNAKDHPKRRLITSRRCPECHEFHIVRFEFPATWAHGFEAMANVCPTTNRVYSLHIEIPQ